MKAAAVLMGPAGVGLIGLLASLSATASAIAGLGLGTVGTRQIAAATADGDPAQMAAARRALFWGALVLAALGATAFWALRGLIATHVLGDATLTDEIGWLSLAVAFAVAATSQTALLNGLRRLGDLARLSVFSGVLSAIVGVGALTLWGREGLIIFVLAAPVASFLLGAIYVARLPKPRMRPTPLNVLTEQWRALAKLGLAFMVAGLAGALGLLLVRTLVNRELGTDALGYFQAASTIAMAYVGFVLSAMGADFLPRLSAVINDHSAVNRLVNDQTEVALLLAGPAFLAMVGGAPWVIDLLYTTSFHPAADALRWHVLGDVLKVASWPLGFIILAAGDGRTYMLTESIAMGAFVLLTWAGLPFFGVTATGIAFLGMYVVLLPLVYWLASRRTGFEWSPLVRQLTGWLSLAAVVTLVAAKWSDFAGAIVGVILSASFALYGFGSLAQKVNLSGPAGRLAGFCRRCLSKLGVRND